MTLIAVLAAIVVWLIGPIIYGLVVRNEDWS